MGIATNLQVQNFVDQRLRPRCEQMRALRLAIEDDIAAIGDVYAALTQTSPTWTDERTDGPPALLLPSDVLAINTVLNDLDNYFKGEAQYPIVMKACVRSEG